MIWFNFFLSTRIHVVGKLGQCSWNSWVEHSYSDKYWNFKVEKKDLRNETFKIFSDFCIVLDPSNGKMLAYMNLIVWEDSTIVWDRLM